MRTFCFSFFLLVSFVQHALADENVLSMVIGLDGVKDLIYFEARQLEIDLDPSQLDALRRLAADEKVVGEYKKVREREYKRMEDSRGAELVAKNVIDGMIKSDIQKILHPEQISARRKLYLRRRFHSPSHVFESEFLRQLGLEPMDIAELQTKVDARRKDVYSELDGLTQQAVAEFMSGLERETQEKFARLFGTKFFPAMKASSGLDYNQIAVFAESSIVRQVKRATSYVLPSGLELSLPQYKVLMDLEREVVTQLAHKNYKGDKATDDKLNEILRPDQRIAVIQTIQNMMLRGDIATVVRPEVTSYMQIVDEELTKKQAIIASWKEKIDTLRKDREKEVFRLGTSLLPKDLKQKAEELFVNVWD